MEQVRVMLGNDKLYDELVHSALPEGGDVVMVTKDRATEGGRPAVCISFSVLQTDGTPGRAQCVITGRNFAMMAGAFRGRYGDGGDMVCTADIVN